MQAQRAERERRRGREGDEGRGKRENSTAKAKHEGAGGGAYLSRKHVLLYYRCSIMCCPSYMVDNSPLVQSNQVNKQKQHNLGGILLKNFQPAKQISRLRLTPSAAI